jgi:hypothetical protein
VEDIKERVLPSKNELETWLRSSVTKALMDDMKERIEDSTKILSGNLLTTPKKVAEANKQIGIIENAEYILVFPSLLLNDIIIEQERQNRKEKE